MYGKLKHLEKLDNGNDSDYKIRFHDDVMLYYWVCDDPIKARKVSDYVNKEVEYQIIEVVNDAAIAYCKIDITEPGTRTHQFGSPLDYSQTPYSDYDIILDSLEIATSLPAKTPKELISHARTIAKYIRTQLDGKKNN